MAETKHKSLLVVVRQSPYGSSLARAAIDSALAAAAFEQPVKLLFMGDGVLQLIKQQRSDAVGVKNIAKVLASLPLYDIEMVYADTAALQRYGLSTEQLATSVVSLDDHQIQRLLLDCDHIVSC